MTKSFSQQWIKTTNCWRLDLPYTALASFCEEAWPPPSSSSCSSPLSFSCSAFFYLSSFFLPFLLHSTPLPPSSSSWSFFIVCPDTLRMWRKSCVTVNQIQGFMHYGWSVVGEASYISYHFLYNQAGTWRVISVGDLWLDSSQFIYVV